MYSKARPTARIFLPVSIDHTMRALAAAPQPALSLSKGLTVLARRGMLRVNRNKFRRSCNKTRNCGRPKRTAQFMLGERSCEERSDEAGPFAGKWVGPAGAAARAMRRGRPTATKLRGRHQQNRVAFRRPDSQNVKAAG